MKERNVLVVVLVLVVAKTIDETKRAIHTIGIELHAGLSIRFSMNEHYCSSSCWRWSRLFTPGRSCTLVACFEYFRLARRPPPTHQNLISTNCVSLDLCVRVAVLLLLLLCCWLGRHTKNKDKCLDV